VRDGRRRGFAALENGAEPPDPQDPATFAASKLDRRRSQHAGNRTLRDYHAELLRLRKTLPALREPRRGGVESTPFEAERALCVHHRTRAGEAVAIFTFAPQPATLALPLPAGVWTKRLDSADARWGGPGSPVPARLQCTAPVRLTLPGHACILFERRSSDEAE
jgi:maltooligosyltrehalose trehalohydrolase